MNKSLFFLPISRAKEKIKVIGIIYPFKPCLLCLWANIFLIFHILSRMWAISMAAYVFYIGFLHSFQPYGSPFHCSEFFTAMMHRLQPLFHAGIFLFA